MIGNYSARLTGSKRNLLALLASSAVFSAGCANMTSTAPQSTPAASAATLSGKIHGGNQPVTGATVSLWYMGQGTSAPVQAAQTTSDGNGSFSFTRIADNTSTPGNTPQYSCPEGSVAGADPLVYVISQGGNTQNNGNTTQSNTAAAFIGVYGICSTLSASNFVYLSEVTTVATMAAVTQFFNPVGDVLSADGTGQQKIIVANLPNTINLLANPTTGLYVPSTVMTSTVGGSSVSVTATPEPGKINLLANIISACINQATSADGNCATLFSAAAPPIPNTTSLNPHSFAPATDTLQALFYIFANPSNGQGSTGTTNLATLFGLAGGVGAPYQPQATKPTDWTIGISYSSTSTCGASGGFINSPFDINIDAQDNVWIANSQTGGNLSSISAAGAPYKCVNFDGGSSQGGGVLDAAANVWFGAGTSLYRFNPGTNATLAFPVTVTPLAITADGTGSVYFSSVSGTTGSVYRIPGAATATSAVAPVQISNAVGANPLRLMADGTGNSTTASNIWVSSGTTSISKLTLSGGTWTTTPFTTSGNSYGIAISSANDIFVSSIDNGNIDRFSLSAGSWAPAGGNWPFSGSAAGIASPTGLAVDGRGNPWIPNNANGASTGSVSELAYFGAVPLSPATGFQKSASFLHSGRASAVDQAGNLWIAGDGSTFVTEIVGAAVPIFTPYSVGINVGRYQKIP